MSLIPKQPVWYEGTQNVHYLCTLQLWLSLTYLGLYFCQKNKGNWDSNWDPSSLLGLVSTPTPRELKNTEQLDDYKWSAPSFNVLKLLSILLMTERGCEPNLFTVLWLPFVKMPLNSFLVLLLFSFRSFELFLYK